MMKCRVDNSKKIYDSTVSIADLAQYSSLIKERDSDTTDIYMVEEFFSEEYRYEIESWEYEYGTGYSVTFKDGSVLHVSAWKTEPLDYREEV